MVIKRVLKWLGLGLGAMIGVILIAVAAVFVHIGRDLAHRHEIVGEPPVPVPADAASVAEGLRLARLRGCAGGCHGRDSEGSVFFEFPDGSELIAPDLGRVAAKYSDGELERAIRHGVRPDGSSVLRAMPSDMFAALTDQDLGAIIAYLRSLEAGERALPDTRFGPVARILLLLFKRQIGSIMAAEVIDHDNGHSQTPPGDPSRHGFYLATTVCTECHGPDLRGYPDEGTPGLAVATAYPLEDFRTLMRSGRPLGGRELGLMAKVAQSRFAYFTDDEVAALHQYLKSRDWNLPGEARK